MFDVIENLSSAVMALQFPDISRTLVTLTQPITLEKLVLFWYLMLPTLIVGIVVLLGRYARSRFQDTGAR